MAPSFSLTQYDMEIQLIWKAKFSCLLFVKLSCKCFLFALRNSKYFLSHDWLNFNWIAFGSCTDCRLPLFLSFASPGHCNFSFSNCPITVFDKEFNMRKGLLFRDRWQADVSGMCRKIQISPGYRRWKEKVSILSHRKLTPYKRQINFGGMEHDKEADNGEALLVWKEARECVYIFLLQNKKLKSNGKRRKMLKFYLWFFTLFAFRRTRKSSPSWAQNENSLK